MTTVDSPVENERVKTRQMPGIPKIKRCDQSCYLYTLEVLICRAIGIVIIILIVIIITWDILVTLSGTKREEFAEKNQDVGYFGGLVLGPADDAPGGLAGMDMDKRGS